MNYMMTMQDHSNQYAGYIKTAQDKTAARLWEVFEMLRNLNANINPSRLVA